MFSTDEIFQRIVAAADEEFARSSFRVLFFSGLAAGLSIGLSFMARAALTAGLPESTSGVIGNLLYPIGFIFIVMGNYQLYTENTLSPVTLVLTRIASLPALLYIWIVVLAQQRGVLQAPHTVVVQDGAPWLWDHIAPLAGPERIEIIDFYHTAAYLSAAIEALLPPDRRAFWKHLLLNHLKLDDQGVEHLTQVLLCLSADLPERPTNVQEALDYLERYGARMHYAHYREQHLQIGSGTVESAANRLVSARLKQAGMRWNPLHAEAMAQVRAAILSQQRWDHFWNTYRPGPRTYRRKQDFSRAA